MQLTLNNIETEVQVDNYLLKICSLNAHKGLKWLIFLQKDAAFCNNCIQIYIQSKNILT